jgi:hypothetical protein
VKFVVGQGTRVNFWKDNWCGDHPDGFVSLPYSLVLPNRDATIAEV